MNAQVFLAVLVTIAEVGTISAQAPRKSKDVEYWSDKFTGAQYWETELFGRSGWDGHGVGLTIRKAIAPLEAGRADTVYLFIANREESDWAFFRGPSQWLIDGERISVGREDDGTDMKRDKVVTRPASGVKVLETAYYHDVTPTFLKRLADARVVELRFPGRNENFTRKFDKKPQERLRRFLSAAVTAGE